MEVSNGYRTAVLITFALYIIVLIAIVWISQAQEKKKAAADFEKTYFNGGRGLGGITLGLMMMATMLSSGTFVGTPGTAYQWGFAFESICLSAALGFYFVLGGIGKKAGIISRRIESVSLIGFIKNRFNNSKAVVTLLAVCFIFFLSAYSATQIVAGARVFEAMTGRSYIIGLLLFGLVVMIYTVAGGMKSAATASVFQGSVMLFAVVALVGGYIIYANKNYGGVAELLQTVANSEAGQRMLGQTNEVWTSKVLISMSIMGAFSAAGLPHVVQGTTTYKNTKSLKTALAIGFGISTVINLLMMTVGPITYAINPELPAPDHATSYLTFMTLPAPVAGVILSGVCAAIQSTIAGMMLIISATIAKDLIKEVIKPDISAKNLKLASQVSLVIAVIVVVILSVNPPQLVQLLVIFAMGGLGSSIAAPLILGMYWKRTNEYGAFAGILGGLVYYILSSKVVPALALGMNAYVMSTVASIVLTVVVSLATPKPPLGVVQVWFGKDYDKAFATRQ